MKSYPNELQAYLPKVFQAKEDTKCTNWKAWAKNLGVWAIMSKVEVPERECFCKEHFSVFRMLDSHHWVNLSRISVISSILVLDFGDESISIQINFEASKISYRRPRLRGYIQEEYSLENLEQVLEKFNSI